MMRRVFFPDDRRQAALAAPLAVVAALFLVVAFWMVVLSDPTPHCRDVDTSTVRECAAPKVKVYELRVTA